VPTSKRVSGRSNRRARKREGESSKAANAVWDWPGSAEIQPDSLYCGDAGELMRGIPNESIHLVVTSPPYWNLVDYEFKGQIGQSSYDEYLKDMLEVWREVERVLIPNGKLCINVPIVPVRKKDDNSQHTRVIKNLSSDIETSIIQGTSLARYSLYIWQKQTTEKMFGSYPYPPNLYEQNTIEFINVLVKPGKPRKLPKAAKEPSALTDEEWMDLTRQVWFIMPADIQRTGGHPAPFPEALPARLVMMYTFRSVPSVGFPGDVVLDPFNGSGTTTHVAKRLGRRFIGIEGSSKYHKMALQRIRHGRAGFDPSSLRSDKMDKRLYNPMRPEKQMWLADLEEGA